MVTHSNGKKLDGGYKISYCHYLWEGDFGGGKEWITLQIHFTHKNL
jgi:hypothetical protein